jgi:hypothetical protein
MKRPDRTYSFLTMSALDVIAMSTGVFVLLTVILLPYYLNEFDARAQTVETQAAAEVLMEEAEAARQSAADAARRSADAEAEAESLEAAIATLIARAAAEREKAARLESQAEQDRRAAAGLATLATKHVIPELDLVFIIDASSSMAGTIAHMSRTMGGLVRILERLVPSLRIGFVAYRDYDVPPWVTRRFVLRPTATDLDAILGFAAALGPPMSGGSSVSEALYSGLTEATMMPLRLGARQVFIVIGDAAAHPHEKAATLRLARAFAAGGAEHSISTLFVETAAYLMYGQGDREFLMRLAEAGGGGFHERAGGMTEAVLLSVLAE